jgi:hypothetical protein
MIIEMMKIFAEFFCCFFFFASLNYTKYISRSKTIFKFYLTAFILCRTTEGNQVLPLAFMQVTAQLNLAKRNTVSSYFHLELNRTWNKTGAVISLNDSGGIARTIIFCVVVG